jgi:hypothetical protein
MAQLSSQLTVLQPKKKLTNHVRKILTLNYKTKPGGVVSVVTLLTCVHEVPDSNRGWDIT